MGGVFAEGEEVNELIRTSVDSREEFVILLEVLNKYAIDHSRIRVETEVSFVKLLPLVAGARIDSAGIEHVSEDFVERPARSEDRKRVHC